MIFNGDDYWRVLKIWWRLIRHSVVHWCLLSSSQLMGVLGIWVQPSQKHPWNKKTEQPLLGSCHSPTCAHQTSSVAVANPEPRPLITPPAMGPRSMTINCRSRLIADPNMSDRPRQGLKVPTRPRIVTNGYHLDRGFATSGLQPSPKYQYCLDYHPGELLQVSSVGHLFVTAARCFMFALLLHFLVIPQHLLVASRWFVIISPSLNHHSAQLLDYLLFDHWRIPIRQSNSKGGIILTTDTRFQPFARTCLVSWG